MNSMSSHFTQKLFSLKGKGSRTFEACAEKDRLLNHPHRAFRSIHIAGTNGKGSVAIKIASSLEKAGFRVGLYTSPHIFSYRERIQINGKQIDDQVAERLFQKAFAPELSFFDVLTLMAFLYFKEQSVDFAVIETGLGGAFDATNVITPILSIITSIGYDHKKILGETLEEIAAQKGGIVKPNVPLIVGPTAAPFFPNGEAISKEPVFEKENRALAKLALLKLGIEPNLGVDAEPPFRFQRIGNLLFDTAHNPPAFQSLKDALLFHYPNQRFRFYLAFSKEKEWRECIRMIEGIASSIQMVRTVHPHLIKSYPGYETVEPSSVKGGVVAGSFYLLEAFSSQITDGAFSRLSH